MAKSTKAEKPAKDTKPTDDAKAAPLNKGEKDVGANAEKIEHGKTTDGVVEAIDEAVAPEVNVRGEAADGEAKGRFDFSDRYDATPHVGATSDEAVPHDVEVAARSADMEKASDTHLKAFVLPGARGKRSGPSDPSPYTEAKGFDHEPNYAATRQGAINAGLWPTGPVKHVSTKRHEDGSSWVLTYSVSVIPAADIRDGSPHPEVIGDDTDDGGATKARNADPTPDSEEAAGK